MGLPRLYSIKDIKYKKKIVTDIVTHLRKLSKDRFPNVCRQIDNDVSKIQLIDTIINNLYGDYPVYSIADAISSIEVTLND